jgi:hypothetical protein
MILSLAARLPHDNRRHGLAVVSKPLHVDVGALAAWIEAIGTVLAFWVALAVFIVALKDRRRQQAAQVAAWLQRGKNKISLHIVNSSDVPIYNVRADAKLLGQSRSFLLPVLGPRADEILVKVPMPGSTQVSEKFANVEVFFVDSSGRRWWRKEDGKLSREHHISAYYIAVYCVLLCVSVGSFIGSRATAGSTSTALFIVFLLMAVATAATGAIARWH